MKLINALTETNRPVSVNTIDNVGKGSKVVYSHKNRDRQNKYTQVVNHLQQSTGLEQSKSREMTCTMANLSGSAAHKSLPSFLHSGREPA